MWFAHKKWQKTDIQIGSAEYGQQQTSAIINRLARFVTCREAADLGVDLPHEVDVEVFQRGDVRVSQREDIRRQRVIRAGRGHGEHAGRLQ